MGKLTEQDLELLRERHLAFLATVNADGTPQVTPVGVDSDGEAILMNTAVGRLKERNLRRHPRASVAVVDPERPNQRSVLAHGNVELIEEGGKEHIDRLAHKYLDRETYPWLQPGERRVTLRLVPE